MQLKQAEEPILLNKMFQNKFLLNFSSKISKRNFTIQAKYYTGKSLSRIIGKYHSLYACVGKKHGF